MRKRHGCHKEILEAGLCCCLDLGYMRNGVFHLASLRTREQALLPRLYLQSFLLIALLAMGNQAPSQAPLHTLDQYVRRMRLQVECRALQVNQRAQRANQYPHASAAFAN